MLTVGSLFSGIGGFDLGLERAGMTISWQVENHDYARKILGKHWPKVPCHYDIKAIDWQDIPNVDLVCGGFPCQPFSVAGKRAGKADDRYLWPEVVRCLDILRPTWFLGENVPGIINLALDQVCADLEGLDYQVWPVCLPACAVDAPHLRQRIWIVAHTERDGRRPRGTECERQQGRTAPVGASNGMAHSDSQPSPTRRQQSVRRPSQTARSGECREAVADASRELLDGSRQAGTRRRGQSTNQSRWPVEPAICRVDHGIPSRVDRLKGLGNAIVPQIAEILGRMILETEAQRC
jgi:DNA (cytosine-5)-methyltransferase 1